MKTAEEKTIVQGEPWVKKFEDLLKKKILVPASAKQKKKTWHNLKLKNVCPRKLPNPPPPPYPPRLKKIIVRP